MSRPIPRWQQRRSNRLQALAEQKEAQKEEMPPSSKKQKMVHVKNQPSLEVNHNIIDSNPGVSSSTEPSAAGSIASESSDLSSENGVFTNEPSLQNGASPDSTSVEVASSMKENAPQLSTFSFQEPTSRVEPLSLGLQETVPSAGLPSFSPLDQLPSTSGDTAISADLTKDSFAGTAPVPIARTKRKRPTNSSGGKSTTNTKGKGKARATAASSMAVFDLTSIPTTAPESTIPVTAPQMVTATESSVPILAPQSPAAPEHSQGKSGTKTKGRAGAQAAAASSDPASDPTAIITTAPEPAILVSASPPVITTISESSVPVLAPKPSAAPEHSQNKVGAKTRDKGKARGKIASSIPVNRPTVITTTVPESTISVSDPTAMMTPTESSVPISAPSQQSVAVPAPPPPVPEPPKRKAKTSTRAKGKAQAIAASSVPVSDIPAITTTDSFVAVPTQLSTNETVLVFAPPPITVTSVLPSAMLEQSKEKSNPSTKPRGKAGTSTRGRSKSRAISTPPPFAVTNSSAPVPALLLITTTSSEPSVPVSVPLPFTTTASESSAPEFVPQPSAPEDSKGKARTRTRGKGKSRDTTASFVPVAAPLAAVATFDYSVPVSVSPAITPPENSKGKARASMRDKGKARDTTTSPIPVSNLPPIAVTDSPISASGPLTTTNAFESPIPLSAPLGHPQGKAGAITTSSIPATILPITTAPNLLPISAPPPNTLTPAPPSASVEHPEKTRLIQIFAPGTTSLVRFAHPDHELANGRDREYAASLVKTLRSRPSDELVDWIAALIASERKMEQQRGEIVDRMGEGQEAIRECRRLKENLLDLEAQKSRWDWEREELERKVSDVEKYKWRMETELKHQVAERKEEESQCRLQRAIVMAERRQRLVAESEAGVAKELHKKESKDLLKMLSEERKRRKLAEKSTDGFQAKWEMKYEALRNSMNRIPVTSFETNRAQLESVIDRSNAGIRPTLFTDPGLPDSAHFAPDHTDTAAQTINPRDLASGHATTPTESRPPIPPVSATFSSDLTQPMMQQHLLSAEGRLGAELAEYNSTRSAKGKNRAADTEPESTFPKGGTEDVNGKKHTTNTELEIAVTQGTAQSDKGKMRAVDADAEPEGTIPKVAVQSQNAKGKKCAADAEPEGSVPRPKKKPYVPRSSAVAESSGASAKKEDKGKGNAEI